MLGCQTKFKVSPSHPIIETTGGMQCEALSHRLGLIPIRIDPEQFGHKTGMPTPTAAVPCYAMGMSHPLDVWNRR